MDKIINELTKFSSDIDIKKFMNLINNNFDFTYFIPVSVPQLKEGDHIIVVRNKEFKYNDEDISFKYTHHGVVVGLNPTEVIHPTDEESFIDKKYVQTDISRFCLDSKDLYIYKYDSNLTPTSEIIKAANSHLANNVKYNLIDYNCETFANLCCTGKYEDSKQVSNSIMYLADCTNNSFIKQSLVNKNILKILVEYIKQRI